ncbi:caspase-8 [Symphorus nematophorus]
MDTLMLSRLDEQLVSDEVAALCFLCRDIVPKKRLEGVRDAKDLFVRLEEQCMLDNHVFLSQLLGTICRADLLSYLETDSRRPEETDANPMLSDYRVMLYNIYEDMTQENLDKMKYLLTNKLGRGRTEACKSALDVFAEMENRDLLSNKKLGELHTVLQQLDQQLALNVQRYMRGIAQQPQTPQPPQRVGSNSLPTQPSLPLAETHPCDVRQNVDTDAQPNTKFSSVSDPDDYYPMTHIPRGLCVVINNEIFSQIDLKNRAGTQQDEKALHNVFTQLGFTVMVYNDLTAQAIRDELNKLGGTNFMDHDALVVCMLSHGENGCVFGTDGKKVSLQELTQPFKSGAAPTLAGKPKLFFIQACQGDDYQKGSAPCPPRPRQEEADRESRLEEDAGPVRGETVPWDADFLLGMATVPQCKSFRHTSTGSIYIQELCRQLLRSAKSLENENINDVLTRVNREVSKGEFLRHKQMPEPKYTLTKKLVLKCVN